ncbi:MAG: histidine phosphatase family protein [Planctomycetes bacterium]|nr:histidine phosphatase family protein [Planctomycetota bacterium]
MLRSVRPTKVYLLRHGEVDEAWRDRVYGALDVPLSQGGVREAERAARTLSEVDLRAVISSGLSRAEHGAERLRASRELQRIEDPELRELERGAWAGVEVGELERREPDAWQAWFRAPSRVRPLGGENLEDLLRRVLPRIWYWARIHEGMNIAVVTHGWVVRVLVCHALGASLDLAPRLDVRTGDIAQLCIRFDGQEPVLELEGFGLDLTPNQFSG